MILGSSGTQLNAAATVYFQLPRGSAAGFDLNYDPSSVQVPHYNEVRAQWEVQQSVFSPGPNLVAEETAQLGIFALVASAYLQERGSTFFINCGGGFTLSDSAGRFWVPDDSFLAQVSPPSQTFLLADGQMDNSRLQNLAIPDQVLFTERTSSSNIVYRIPAPNDSYRVVLYFWENHPELVGPELGGQGCTNCARVLTLQVEDQVIMNFNPADAALPPAGDGDGATFVATAVPFDVNVTDGYLDLKIIDNGPGNPPGDAMIQAITVLRGGQCSSLCIELVGDKVLVSWSGTGLTLQSAAQINGPWNDFSSGTTTDGQNYSLLLAPSATSQFFRLRAD
jgi:hypothetical protein